MTRSRIATISPHGDLWKAKGERIYEKTNNKRECMNCGLEGHMRSTCAKPAADTEFRYAVRKEKNIL